MDERAAIEQYDRAGAAQGARFGGVRWPDLALQPHVLARVAEGLLDARVNFAELAFGDEIDVEAVSDRLEEAWRRDGLQMRFAPEGVFVRVAFAIRVALVSAEEDLVDPEAAENLEVTAEFCVSFTQRHHTRPFVDFMGGEIRRARDGSITRVDPFACEVSPVDAVAWRLHECAD